MKTPRRKPRKATSHQLNATLWAYHVGRLSTEIDRAEVAVNRLRTKRARRLSAVALLIVATLAATGCGSMSTRQAGYDVPDYEAGIVPASGHTSPMDYAFPLETYIPNR